MKFDPRKPFDIWLECFEDVPKEDRPVFKARRCTASELDAVNEARGDATKFNLFTEAAKLLMGWSNQYTPDEKEVPYCAETADADLRKLISFQECYELLAKISAGNQVSVEDKKK